MGTEIITAIIAFIGVVTSVLASYIVNSRQVNTEVQKLRTEIQQTYASKLLEKRIEVYPALYKLLSDFGKVVRNDAISTELIMDLLTHTREWDSNYAIFMSGYAGRTLYEFQKWLNDLANLPEDKFIDEWDTTEKRWVLRREASKVELAIKRDLGIYIVEFKDTEIKFTYYDEYEEKLGIKSSTS